MGKLTLCYVGLIFHSIFLVFSYRKNLSIFFRNPLAIIYDNVKNNSQIDSKYLSYFMSRKRNILEFAYLELVAEKQAFEKRTSLIVGAIEKVGLAPGVFALLLSLDKVKDIKIDWVLSIAYAIPIFYIIGLFSHILTIRMSRHISLLKYAIEKKT